MVKVAVNRDDISHIKMFKGDALYEDYRSMPNVKICNEDSDDEYIVFYTIGESYVEKANECAKRFGNSKICHIVE